MRGVASPEACTVASSIVEGPVSPPLRGGGALFYAALGRLGTAVENRKTPRTQPPVQGISARSIRLAAALLDRPRAMGQAVSTAPGRQPAEQRCKAESPPNGAAFAGDGELPIRRNKEFGMRRIVQLLVTTAGMLGSALLLATQLWQHLRQRGHSHDRE
jgi:hypothetical protein